MEIALWIVAIAVDAHLTETGKTRKTAIDGRTTRHPGYVISQRTRVYDARCAD